MRVESRCRLVEKQQLGLADESARDGQPLFLTARESVDPCPPLFLQFNQGKDFLDRVRLPVERAEQRQRLGDGELVGKLGFLQLNAEPLA